MKLTPISEGACRFPKDISCFISGARLFDSSSSPEARVYFVERGAGYYIKRAPRGTLYNEASLNSYFHSLGLGPKVISYTSSDEDFLITERVLGEDLTHGSYLNEPNRLAAFLGTTLRRLHEVDFHACPKKERLGEYLSVAKKRAACGIFDPTYSKNKHISQKDAIEILEGSSDELTCDTLTHGDYCLPNVIARNFTLSAFIDLGYGGVSDRHVDLFWGEWTLNFNLGTYAYSDIFFDAYGRDKIDFSKIELVSIIECFG